MPLHSKLLWLICLIPSFLFGQTPTRANFTIHINKATEPITVDGKLEEALWKTADKAENFWEKSPIVQPNVDVKTEVQMTYDEEFVYIGITCFDSTNHIVQSLKRDENYWDSDAIGVLIDPVNQQTNGFMFGVNTLGVQMEALISTGSNNVMNRGWDNKWTAESHQLEDRWTVEMAIPFKTLRYEANKTVWGINFIRNDIKNNRYHTWTEVPQQFRGIDIGYTGQLIWDKAPPLAKGNIAIIPYVTSSYVNDIEADPSQQGKVNAGLDAKIAVSSSLNLDLSVNPDFSTVDVDQAVTNLTRFSISLPERRTFFLENSDIFSSFGVESIRPFFSRRIGLNEDNEPQTILYGARLSGNLNKDWRVGVMNLQTKGDEENIGQNFTVASLQRRVFARSTIKAMFQNRQGIEGTEINDKDYGRNGSLEFNYTTKDGKWSSWAGYNYSWKDGFTKDNDFYNTGVNYQGKKLRLRTSFLKIGTNYFADQGFIRRIENYDSVRDTIIRQGFTEWSSNANYQILTPNHSKINRHNIFIENTVVWNPNGSFNERATNILYVIGYRNRSRFSISIDNQEIDLQFPFQFFDDVDPFPTQKYRFTSGRISYRSDERKRFVYNTQVRHGSFYNGTRTSYNLGLNYRVQPWGNFGINLEQNSLRFPEGFGEQDLFLINSNISINFSKKIFWTTFVTLNTQSSDFRINSRLQWRYQPMSDIFLVFSDNYGGEPFESTYRAVLLKINYWFAI